MAGSNNNEVKVTVTAVDKTKEAFEQVHHGLEKIGLNSELLKEQFAGLLAVFTAGGLIEFAKHTLEAAEKMADLAQKTGISTEQLSAYKNLADQSGTSLDAVANSMNKLARNMAQAAIGTGTAATSFKAIGVEVLDANGHLRDTDTVMQEVAERFAGYKDGAGKAALAQQIFGRSGAELIPFLNDGAEGLKKSREEAEKYGFVLGGDTARQAKAFMDEMALIKNVLGGVGTRVVAEVLPALKQLSGVFLNAAERGNTLSGAVETLATALKLALSVATAFFTLFQVGGTIVGGVAAAVVAVAKGEFAQAKNVLDDLDRDMTASAKKAGDAFRAIWSGAAPGAKPEQREQTDAPVAQAPGKAANDAAERLAALKASIAAELALLKDANARALGDLTQQLKDHLVDIRGYYAQRVQLEQQTIDDEIAAKRKGLQEEQLKAADRIRIDNEIILLERKRGDVAVKAARDQADAEDKLRDKLEGVRAALLRAQGETGAAAKLQLQQQYKDLLDTLQAQGDTAGTSLVRKLIDVEGARADLQQVEADAQRIMSEMRLSEQGIQAQVTTGLLTQAQGQERIAALHKETSQQVEQLIPKMEQLALATGNPDAIVRVQQLRQQVEALVQTSNQWAIQLQGKLQSGLAQFFSDISTGARTAGDAFRAFAKGIVDDIAKMASQALAADLMKKLLGGGSGAGGGAGFFTALASAFGFADGGLVSGPGSGTSDSIPARLSNGEYVVNASAVQRVGVGLLDGLNSLGRGPGGASMGSLGFAAGGLVPALAPQQGSSVRIVNVVDPAMAGDWINSAAGEKTIINLLQRNAGAVRQVLA
ncbi:MAG: phage tail tape measure protein [Burkholderiales bacterium]|nr:phage tail tape measure protein [Burkholderiales bacterium]